ncbi:hypothetical protein DE146DRAFT_614732 [Phaeosphaeria sp. MPI-PUGE-AT-0046c]|nr:hypothetical protein DE146DRAFT_614732 [Phaeosphaeria sp. MPI-PUGE-AT-0046c]
MVDVELPCTNSLTNKVESDATTRVSRFENLGLNARPVKFVGWKEPSPGLSVHTPIYAAAAPPQAIPPRPSHQQHWTEDSNDLVVLEAMMVPAGLRQGYRERVNVPIDPRPQIVKSSKFTTGLVSTSGWNAINNPNNEASISHEPIPDVTEDMVPEDKFVGYDDLPGVLAKKAQLAQSIEKTELDATMHEITRDAETPYLDGKYFDLDSYLEHSQGTNGKAKPTPAGVSKRISIRTKAASTTEQHQTAAALTASSSGVSPSTTNRSPSRLPIIAKDDRDAKDDRETLSSPKTTGSSNENPPPNSKDMYVSIHNTRSSMSNNNSTSLLSSRRWQPIEDSYLLLFYKKILEAVKGGHTVRSPGPTPLTDAFNNFFVGKVLAPDLPACQPRGEASLKGKLQISTGEVKAMRDLTRSLLEGRKTGSLYVPVITQEELEAFMADGAVQVDDPNNEAKNEAKSPKRKRNVKDDVGGDDK